MSPQNRTYRLVLETRSELVRAPDAETAARDYNDRRHDHYMATGDELERCTSVYLDEVTA